MKIEDKIDSKESIIKNYNIIEHNFQMKIEEKNDSMEIKNNIITIHHV